MSDENSVDRVQQAFADLLIRFVRIGLTVLTISFFVYVFGVLSSPIAPSDVAELWHLEASEYIRVTDKATGWTWVHTIFSGNGFAFAALALFPAGTIALVAYTVFLYLRQRDRIYATIAFLELVILIVAATGIFSTGH